VIRVLCLCLVVFDAGDDDVLIQVTVTAKDMNNAAVLPGQLMVMEAYTNTPQCAPMAATPNCPVTCIPYNTPWVRSRSCDSVPHVNSAQMVTPSKSTCVGCWHISGFGGLVGEVSNHLFLFIFYGGVR
jgi:hypothetical protein